MTAVPWTKKTSIHHHCILNIVDEIMMNRKLYGNALFWDRHQKIKRENVHSKKYEMKIAKSLNLPKLSRNHSSWQISKKSYVPLTLTPQTKMHCYPQNAYNSPTISSNTTLLRNYQFDLPFTTAIWQKCTAKFDATPYVIKSGYVVLGWLWEGQRWRRSLYELRKMKRF